MVTETETKISGCSRTQASDDGSLARCGRSGEHGEVRLGHDRGDGGVWTDRRTRRSARRSDACPEPRSLRFAAMSSLSMTLLARTSPTRGNAFSTSTTLAWAMTSSISARSST